MRLSRFSLGLGDRFGLEGTAQLRAVQMALGKGVTVTPVWNKSNREHTLIGTEPKNTREAADAAVAAGGWTGPYLVDADHITSASVDRFLEASDYFTIDVADALGRPSEPERSEAFLKSMTSLKGRHDIPGLPGPVVVSDELLKGVAGRYLGAIQEAERVYRRIEAAKGKGNFVTEVSIDESAEPQTAAELLLVLGALAGAGVPVQTIAPKFSGAFLKGIDFVGDPEAFAAEFEADIAVIDYARRTFGMDPELKLSIHTGSDKFSLYPVIRRVAESTGAGFHLKTAGTTWLEEVIGLAAVGGEGLRAAKRIYSAAWGRFDEMIEPYLQVVAIDRRRLPDPREVDGWDSGTFVRTLEHEPSRKEYSIHFRQLVHTAFRVAAEMGPAFAALLKEHRGVIEEHVTDNIFRRHVAPLFLGEVVHPSSHATIERTGNGI